MPSTYTLNNGIELIGTGEQSGTWGDTTNTNFELLDTALDGQVSVTLAATGSSGSPNTLPISDGASSNGRNRLVIFGDGGELGGTAFVQLTPNDSEKIIYVRNNLAGSRSILLFQGTYNASNDYEVPAGTTAVVFFNGAGSGAVAANVFNNAHFDALNIVGAAAVGTTLTVGTSLNIASSTTVDGVLDEDNMASNSATKLSTQQSIKAYVDSQVGTVDTLAEILANGNTTGGTDIAVSTGDDITFADSSKAIFGAGSDLEILHDGTDSWIREAGSGTGSLKIRANNLLAYSNSDEPYFQGVTNGAFRIYYDGLTKLATTNTGVDITGTLVSDGLTVDGTATFTTSDNNPQLIIKSTDADSNDGPVFYLVRDSASPADNDFIGSIRFRADDSAGNETQYADIRVITNDVTDGTEDGQFNLRTMLGGTLRLRLKADPTETVFNEEGENLDFRVESDGNANMLFVDAGANLIGVGTNAPSHPSGSGITIYDASVPRIAFKNSTTGNTSTDGGEILMSGNQMYVQNRENESLFLTTNATTRVTVGTAETAINDGSYDYDFRVESDNNANMLFVDAAADQVRIGQSSSSVPSAAAKLYVQDGATTDYSGQFSMSYQAGTYTDYYKGMTGLDLSNSIARGLHIFNYDNDSDAGINFWSGRPTVGTSVIMATFGPSNVIFNDGGADRDFRVESDAASHMLFVDAGNDRVGIATNSPDDVLTVGGETLSYANALDGHTLGIRGGVLGGTAGDEKDIAYFAAESTNNNTIGLSLKAYRRSTGNDWTSAGFKYTLNVDNTDSVYDNLLVFQGAKIGIGTDTPSTQVNIESTAPHLLLRHPTGGAVDLTLARYNDDDAYTDWIFHSEAGVVTIFSDDTVAADADRLNITFDGRVNINEGGDPLADFRVESDTSNSALFLDASESTVGINTTSTSATGLNITGPNNNSYGQLRIAVTGSADAQVSLGTTSNGRGFYVDESSTNDFVIYGGAGKGSTGEFRISNLGNVTINGSLSKSSGSFRIPHPIASKTETHDLIHSFVEAPQADNIYRGKVDLVAGQAAVNIDTVAGMTDGTFVLLNREIQCFTSNETGWTAVRGSVSGNILTIEAQDSSCTDTISWLVIGERQDQHMYDTEWTDENGKVIVEPLKS